MQRRVAAMVLVALFASVAAASIAQAAFAASQGFSGRNGFDCSVCHTPDNAPWPEATIHIDGLPPAWEPGETYPVTLEVRGGPPRAAGAPALVPQGGFELETDVGRLVIPPGMEGLLRSFAPGGITYLPEGTLTRTWNLQWIAPAVDAWPRDATFWAAGVAANGNHNMQLNSSDGGELGDRTARIKLEIPADPVAVAAWQAMPLPAPDVAVARGDGSPPTWRVQVSTTDRNATSVYLFLNAQDPQPLSLTEGRAEAAIEAEPGTVLQVALSGSARSSPIVSVQLGGDERTPVPGMVLAACLLVGSAQLARTRGR